LVDDWVEIEVADTGIGIPPAMQARIFDLFAQVKKPTGDPQEGLGIGLALVRQLVALHGGALSLKHSVPGEGSVFQVRLPTVEALVG
jgi:signal transduction histidine kinase